MEFKQTMSLTASKSPSDMLDMTMKQDWKLKKKLISFLLPNYHFKVQVKNEYNAQLYFLADQVLEVMKNVRYLGRIIRSDLCDDDDVHCQYCKLYSQANMVACKFHMCTDEVNMALF